MGSVLGLVGGIALASGIKRLLDALKYQIPARGLAVEAPTVVITVVAGVLASLVAATGPAIGAGRVPPVAAMTDSVLERVRNPRRRVIGAVVCSVLGILAIVRVMTGGSAMLLAVGVVGLFAAVLLLGPVLARPIARFIGAPVQRVRGVTGTMARGNVQRNPRRTARTAAPVLIGVALVTGASVFASSIKEQIRVAVGESFVGDYVINSTKGGAVSLGQDFVDQLNQLPVVGTATGLALARGVALDRGGALHPRGVSRRARGDAPGDVPHASTAWACTGCHACRERCDHENGVAPTLLDVLGRQEATLTRPALLLLGMLRYEEQECGTRERRQIGRAHV